MTHYKITGGICLDHIGDADRLQNTLNMILDIAHNGEGQSWIKLVKVGEEE